MADVNNKGGAHVHGADYDNARVSVSRAFSEGLPMFQQEQSHHHKEQPSAATL